MLRGPFLESIMRNISPARRNRMILIAVTLVILLWLSYAARSELLPFGFGLLVAYVLAPLAGWLERFLPKRGILSRFSRVLSVLIVYLAIGAILAIVAVFLLPGFVSGIQDFINQLPEYVTSARETVQEWTEKYGRLLPPDIRDQVSNAVEGLVPTIISNMQKLVPRALGVVFNTFSFFLGLFSLPIWLFFVIRDRDKLAASFYSLFPPGPRQMARDIVGIVDRVLTGYIRARFTMALVVGTMVSIGLLILNVKFAIVLGSVAASMELVPIVGPFLGAIPAVVVGLATSPDKVLWIIVVFLAVQLLENNLLDPVIQGGFLQLHPAVIIVSLVVASAVFGIVGMFVAGLVVALAREIFRYLYSRWSEEEAGVAPQLEEQDKSG